jgi:hypothetical protein
MSVRNSIHPVENKRLLGPKSPRLLISFDTLPARRSLYHSDKELKEEKNSHPKKRREARQLKLVMFRDVSSKQQGSIPAWAFFSFFSHANDYKMPQMSQICDTEVRQAFSEYLVLLNLLFLFRERIFF